MVVGLDPRPDPGRGGGGGRGRGRPGRGEPGIALPDDLDPTPDPAPYVALLPALDPTTMGWQNRGWFLGEHAKALFDTNGNAGPTLWWDGRVVGGWAQRKTGEVVLRFLTDAGAGPGPPPRPRPPAAGMAGRRPDHAAVPDAAGEGAHQLSRRRCRPLDRQG